MKKITELLEKGVEDGVFPGASFAYGTPGDFESGAVGRHTYSEDSPEITASTLFDMASVTKVVSTTSTALVLNQHDQIELDTAASSYDSKFQHEAVKVRDLLLHKSGLPAYKRFEKTCRSIEESEDALYALSLREAVPPKTEYSCMGFMIMQRVIQNVTEKTLADTVKELVWDPLGMNRTTYNPGKAVRPLCAPTETIPDWRREIEDERGYERVNEEFVQGGVHDPAAFMMGGISGNAGVFSSANDMALWAQELASGGDKIFSPLVLAEWRRRQAEDSSRGLGFDTKSSRNSSAGRRFDIKSFGHSGYTGTCVWIDPTNKIFGVLLTNRVHPDDKGGGISQIRPKFFDAVWETLQES
jgi:CubicO group peptidase (beta-lactamase class C family)